MTLTIGGTIGVVDEPAITGAWFSEETVRSAWTRALNAKPSMTLVDHVGNVLARSDDGSLNVGLQKEWIVAQAELADNWVTSIAAERVRSGAYAGLSVAYRVRTETWSNDFTRREVTGIDLDGSTISLEWSDSTYRARLRLERRGRTTLRERRALAGNLLGHGIAEMHAGLTVYTEAELKALEKAGTR
jgi:phage head maturation protease